MKLKKIFILSLFVFTIIFISSCEEDNLTEQEDHFVPIGTAIYDATGALYASILGGETSDTIRITNGELSDHFEVKFYDEENNIVDAPESDDIKMNYDVGNSSILELWQHEGEEGEFEFHLRGLKEGTTTLELLIEHNGHNDYRSGLVPVVVK